MGYSSSFSGVPRIYVPSSLITTYQANSVWSYFSSYFKAIEDILTFYFGSPANKKEYSGEKGMTWSEWCNSEYNNEGWFIDE